MAALTKAQLAEQLEASHVAYQKLVTERDSLRGELALAQHALAAQVAGKAALPAKYLRHVPSLEAITAHDAYLQRCTAARALAMRGGITVRVS